MMIRVSKRSVYKLRPAVIAAVALAVVVLGCKQERPSPPDSSPNLLLISIDTLRADHLGCYGYERPTSPNIDAFAARATLFSDALSTAPKTAESHMSMFTSLYPTVHGIGTLPDDADMESDVPVLSPEVRTLAEILHERGYATAGTHGGGFMDAKFGFGKGFDTYERSDLDATVEWLEENAAKRPFFVFYHTYEVHDPYTPQPPYDTMFTGEYKGRIEHRRDRLQEQLGSEDWSLIAARYWELVDEDDPADARHLEALYDGEIASIDKALVALLEAIDEHAPNTLVVILSDHGEEFGEHGQFTHDQIYRELLHVPLIIREPGQTRGARVDEPVSLIDLAPTLLDLLGLPSPEQFQGQSLVPLIEASKAGQPTETAAGKRKPSPFAGTAHAASEAAVPETELYSSLPGAKMYALGDGKLHLISTERGFELYDMKVDPGQTNNLLRGSGAKSPLTKESFEQMQTWLSQRQQANLLLRKRYDDTAATDQLDAETIEQLRALGYLY